jgi:N-acetylmuramic acid 6-phosphate etherase
MPTAPEPASPLPVDALPRRDALVAMLAAHVAAAQAVADGLDGIAAAAERVAQAVTAGGTLVYCAAGSSGLMALADAAELPGTFGVPQRQIRIAMAGGVPVDGAMPGDTEDDTGAARDIADACGPHDLALVLSASGTTPFAVAIAEAMRAAGIPVIALSTTPGSRLLDLADIAIAIPTAPEVVAGSTRLGSGTAQKIALNMISTQAGILLGHVHDGMMVNLHADNTKLRARAAAIVARIAQVPDDAAQSALAAAGQNTKLAVLIAAGAGQETATRLLADHDDRLRPALADLARANQNAT